MAAAAPHAAACLHCGLAAQAGDRYCCYGCEIAARVGSEGREEQTRARAVLTLCLLLSMAVMMLSLFLFAEDVYDARPTGQLAFLTEAYRVASLVLSTPVVIMLGAPILARARRLLVGGRLSMDLLVAVGAAAAYGLSVESVLTGRRGIYFDSASAALLLSTLGRYLEARGRASASRLLGPSLSRSYEPVMVLRDGAYERVAPALVAPGDRLRVAVEEVLPVDAEVVLAPVEVNLGVLTGEPEPVMKQPGEVVPAGAVPVSGALECVALRSSRSSTLERLAALSKALHETPSRLQRWADRFAAWLTPVVFLVATGTFAYWLSHESLARAVVVSLAVVLAACPCTYGVVSPLVYWLALRKALEHGVLVRSASVLEEIARVDAVAFDKTGTLTERDLSVTGFELADGASEAEVLGLLAALEEGQRHPVARAVLAYAEQRGAAPAELRRVTLAAGLGVSAIDMENREILLGAPRLLGGRGVDASAFVGARVVLARAGAPLAALRVGEAVRPEARATIDALASARVRAVVLTGDGAEGARRIADELSVPAFGELSAVEKIERLDALGPRAAMVGDGLNDAPALARVGPSFAMDGGTDLARGMAHVALLRPDLRLVPWAIGLARRAVSLARASLALSTAYNLLFLALAAAGALRPVWAGVAMATSSLLMVASAMRVTAFEGPGEASS